VGVVPVRVAGRGRSRPSRVMSPSRRRVGWWLLLPALLLAALSVGASLAVEPVRDAFEHAGSGPPPSLAAATLDGKRKVKGAVCIDQAQDMSGSMEAYAAQRDRAVGQLLEFARRELRDDDLLAEAVFAGSGAVTLPPTSVHTVGSERRPVPSLEPGTLLAPAVDALARERNPRCAAKALVAVTDGQIFDDPADLGPKLTAAGYSRVVFMIPGVPGWESGDAISVLPANVTVRYFVGPDDLGVAFGEVAAALTGERLTKKGTT
jgi:hypothetical protein